jgi:hypothetical protein
MPARLCGIFRGYLNSCVTQRLPLTDSTPCFTIRTAVTLARVNIVYTGASSLPSVCDVYGAKFLYLGPSLAVKHGQNNHEMLK